MPMMVTPISLSLARQHPQDDGQKGGQHQGGQKIHMGGYAIE